MTEERKIVIPGETIVSGSNYLPGDGAYRDGDDVVANVYGIVSMFDNQVKVIPLSGTYFARRGNTIIGTIDDITMNGWLVDFGGPNRAFLSLNEIPRYINKNELRDYLDYGDSIVARVWDVKGRSIDLSIKMRGFGKIEDGMFMDVNPNKVPRIIGKEGSMVKLIRDSTGCNITVGQNGRIWIKGQDTNNEIKVRQIINYIVDNSIVIGLTEKTEDFIRSLGFTIKENVEQSVIEVQGEEIPTEGAE